MRYSLGSTLLLSISLVLFGCDSSSDTDAGAVDAGPAIDSGRFDAGVFDAGAPNDSGRDDAGVDAGGGCAEDCSAIVPPPCQMSVCNDGSLPGTPGECTTVALADGMACDDSDFCTVGDTCTAGVCDGDPNDCGMTAAECRTVLCNSATSTCSIGADPTQNGMACTVADLCVSGTMCSDGLCTGGTRMDCSAFPFTPDCQAPICNAATGACEAMNINEGGGCIDPGDACIVDNTCTAGVCGGGSTPPDCSPLDSACSVGMCNPTDGSCVAMAINEGMACDDGMTCTSGTTCTAGVCGGGTSPACSLTPDGCCPGTCTTTNDADCACPGFTLGGTCVYLPSTVSSPDRATAQAVCTGLGPGWDLCPAATLCDAATRTYLATSGCDCAGGAATCACGSAANLYIHIGDPGATGPYYMRGTEFPTCFTTMSCTSSVSETCGVALCCR
ncbi:MAG: hypothetical protein AB7S26_18465 [Sandaracinaceae bacterium]